MFLLSVIFSSSEVVYLLGNILLWYFSLSTDCQVDYVTDGGSLIELKLKYLYGRRTFADKYSIKM